MKKTIFFMLVVLILLTSCSKDKEQTDNDDISGKASESVYPLTGVQSDEGTDDRTIGVMVNNHPKARPQSGLSQADIVFEILAEGQITRFLALFQSETPDVVGPVRSAREYYFDLAAGYDAIYVYHGAANFVNDMIEDQNIEHLNGALYDDDGVLFKRESFRKAPHNSYLQFGAVHDEAAQQGYPTTATDEPLPFLDEGADVQGEAAEHVKIDYTKGGSGTVVEFDYDKNSGKYNRSSDGEKTVELDSEAPIQVANVFIVEAAHEVFDDEGRRKIDLTSGGNAYLIQQGKVKQIQWENKNGRIIPVEDGKAVGFVPGKTWVNVIPTDPGIEQAVIISDE